jgi:hypothetical protein
MRKYTVTIEIESEFSKGNKGNHAILIAQTLELIASEIRKGKQDIAGPVIREFESVGFYYLEDRNPIERKKS